ncbi:MULTISPECIES: PAAR domain-containing protein [Pseudomonas]|nr:MULTISPECIES: PAAR domain-containing protein [Pseudomonas]MCF5114420.1 PAAR domain-containing protein [Pseudomonas lactis]MCF5126194.1 PAAR domain-containing protein [Pseudomonas lactis]MCF5371008.1 PAAR domain-containing protein [Pseudomonas sp. PA-4-8C]
MSKGHYVVLGDQTTCGGRVLEGDPTFKLHGLHRVLEGARVTCGNHAGDFRILGGISNMRRNGKRVAGTLDSVSSCPCRARLIPSVLKATYEKRAAEPPASQRADQPNEATVNGNPVTSSQSAFTPAGRTVPTAFSGAHGQEPGFYIVPQSMTREALEATLFPTLDAAVMRKFQALNPNTSHVKAGSMIVLSDPNNTSCTYQEAQLMQAAQHVSASLDELTPDEADFLYRQGAEIAGFIGHTSTWLGVSAVVMEKHLSNLRETLQAMERLHQDSYRQHGHLRSAQFFADRQRLMNQLDAHLLNSTRLRGQTTLGDHPKLKAALGISSRSLVHHWDKAGGPGQIPGYAAHVEAVSRATKYMKTGGYIGIGLGAVSSLLAIQQVCKGDSAAACKKVKFTEGGKFGLSTVGGAWGGRLGLQASGPVCLALGISTAIGGVICAAALVGTGAWVGTTAGGVGGELGGEILHEKTAL